MRRPVPLGKYLLLDRIAVGGMAEVFAGKTFGAAGFERIVAIKRILPNMVEDEEFITMFIDEARIAARLSHANIVQIHELGQHEDTWYMAMEYVSGRDVRSIIEKYRRRKQTMPVPLAVFVAAKVAEGLDYAHRKRDFDGRALDLIHRDISPQNVLVSYEGEVKIIDFGIAKAAGRVQKTQSGVLKGKFGYMSPEQVRGLEIDHRSDLFSLGVMFYEMLTGTKLFTSDSDFSTLERVRAGEVPPPREVNPDISPQLEQIVLKALARNRDERYQCGDEMAEDLLRFLYSSEDVYTTRTLGSFMKETFTDELKREQERLRRWLAASIDDAQVTIRPRDASDDSDPAGLRPSSSPDAPGKKIRIGPPSAFEGAEVKAEDSTTIFEPFQGNAAAPIPTAEAAQNAPSRRPSAPPASPPVMVPRKEGKTAQDATPRPSRRLDEPRGSGSGRRHVLLAAAGIAVLLLGGLGLVFGSRSDAPARGTLSVALDPPVAGAVIELDGSRLAGAPPITRRLEAGAHRLAVRAEGYRSFEKSFEVRAGDRLELQVSLERIEGKDEVGPDPAPVAAANEARPAEEEEDSFESTPVVQRRSEPSASAPARPRSERATATARPASTQQPATGSTQPGELLVFSDPRGAVLSIDGLVVGPTPQRIPDLPGGSELSLRLALEGHRTTTQTVRIPPGGRERVMVRLEQAGATTTGSGPALLIANCTPVAKVFVDGKDTGRYTPVTPRRPLEVEPGRRTIACVTETGRKERVVTLQPGETYKFIETID